MKQITAIFALLALPMALCAQDLVVTNNGDSLNCKITKVKKDEISFIYNQNDDIQSLTLPRSQIKTYRHGYYTNSAISATQFHKQSKPTRFSIGAYGGLSSILGVIPDTLDDVNKKFLKDLKSGYHWGGEASYYFNQVIGVGVNFAMFNTTAKVDLGTSSLFTAYSDAIRIISIGPSFNARFFVNKKKRSALTVQTSISYIDYLEHFTSQEVQRMPSGSTFTQDIDDITAKGSTVGFIQGFGFDCRLARYISIFARTSIMIGTILKYTIDDGTDVTTYNALNNTINNAAPRYDETVSAISASRVDLSFGMRLHF